MAIRSGLAATRARSGTFADRLDPRANSLNVIRLVLAAMVIVSHTWPLGGYGTEPLHGGLTPGGWAVDAFFCLSGYLITGSRVTHSFVTFVRHRILRIYPGFLVCLLATVLIWAPIGYWYQHNTLRGYATSGNSPYHFLVSDLYLKMNTYKISGTPTGPHSWNGSLWSLWFEFLCYVIVGALASLAVYRRRPVVCALLLAAASYASISNLGTWSALQWGQMYELVRLVPFFLAGSLVYLFRAKLPCTWPLALLSAVALGVWPILGGHRWLVLCALPLAYLLLYLGAVVPLTFARANDISFGIYIYGFPVEQLMRLANFQSQTIYTIATILGTVPLAVASWWFVERPMMRWGRGARQRHRGRHRAEPPRRLVRGQPQRELALSSR